MIEFKDKVLYDILTHSFRRDLYGMYFIQMVGRNITLIKDPTSPLDFEFKVYVDMKYVRNICGTFVNVNMLDYNFDSNIKVLNILANCVYKRPVLDDYIIVSETNTNNIEAYEMYVRGDKITLKNIPTHKMYILYDYKQYLIEL